MTPSPSTTSTRSSLVRKKEIKKMTGNLNLFSFFLINTGFKSGGLVFDEMEIRHGLTFVPYTNQLIGLWKGPVAVSEIDTMTWEQGDIQEQMATKAFQLFFVSTDGSVCVPLGFKATDSIDGEGAFELLKPLINQFAEHGISIEWRSSDGIASNKKLIQLIKDNKMLYLHFFDASHVLKNLRSALENYHIVTDTCKAGFSMDIDHYKVLVKRELLAELAKETGEAEKGLLAYLTSMRNFHLPFLDNEIAWETREKIAKEAPVYFTSLTQKIGDATKSPISDGLAD